MVVIEDVMVSYLQDDANPSVRVLKRDNPYAGGREFPGLEEKIEPLRKITYSRGYAVPYGLLSRLGLTPEEVTIFTDGEVAEGEVKVITMKAVIAMTGRAANALEIPLEEFDRLKELEKGHSATVTRNDELAAKLFKYRAAPWWQRIQYVFTRSVK